MKCGFGMFSKEIGDIFIKWNNGVFDFFLIEIIKDIMYFNDEDGKFFVEKIFDKVGQKGIGKWIVVNVLDLGMFVIFIVEFVFVCCLFGIKEECVKVFIKFEFVGCVIIFEGNKEQFFEDFEQVFYVFKIIFYV